MRVQSRAISTKRPAKVFFSYAHTDEEFRVQLGRHLSFLWRAGLVDDPWHDRKILPGQDWAGEIDRNLEAADLVLFLVSPDFAASDYCWDVEMQNAFLRHEAGETLAIPVIVRPAPGWQSSPLGKLQAVPTDGRPVSEWSNRDQAYRIIVDELRELIAHQRAEPSTVPSTVRWTLQTSGTLEEFPPGRRKALVEALRELIGDESLWLNRVEGGSVRLRFTGSERGFQEARNLNSQHRLAASIGIDDAVLSSDVGAAIRIVARTSNIETEPLESHVVSVANSDPNTIWPPIVTGLSFPVDNFLELGFLLRSHPDDELTSQDTNALQTRLGRYLNTMLVVPGEQLNVNLTPNEDWCGLPTLLRGTELGRDLLAQDLELKRYVVELLHPDQEAGAEFWQTWEQSDFGNSTCIRVWLVPGSAKVEESNVNGRVTVSITGMELHALCDTDYQYLGVSNVAPEEPRLLEAFRRSVIPAVQRAVNRHARFGLLRQIYSVLVSAKWIRDRTGDALAGFVDSGAVEPFIVESASFESRQIEALYRRLFGSDGWRYRRRHMDPETGEVVQRVYVAGGLTL